MRLTTARHCPQKTVSVSDVKRLKFAVEASILSIKAPCVSVAFQNWPRMDLTTYSADADAVLALEGLWAGDILRLALNYSFAGEIVGTAINP